MINPSTVFHDRDGAVLCTYAKLCSQVDSTQNCGRMSYCMADTSVQRPANTQVHKDTARARHPTRHILLVPNGYTSIVYDNVFPSKVVQGCSIVYTTYTYVPNIGSIGRGFTCSPPKLWPCRLTCSPCSWFSPLVAEKPAACPDYLRLNV